MIQLRRPRGASGRSRRRGQALVEFALVAPIVLLLLLITIDFGRALYGWVVLQNSARIAANFAGLNPDGWEGAGNASVKARYDAEITKDLVAANCDSFGSGTGTGTAPDPTFIDGPDTSDPDGPADTAYDVGDLARVHLTCTFHPMTPIISAILGNNVQLGASSEFRIRTGTVTGFANPTAIPPPVVPSVAPSAGPSSSAAPVCTLTASFTRSPSGNNINTGTQVTFTPTYTATNCTIAAYLWTFPKGSPGTSALAVPPVVTFTTTTNTSVTVTLQVTSSTGLVVTASDTFNLKK